MLTTIIEKYLLSIEQSTFQKMMDHLLYLEGYKFLGSPGSVIGKNKTSKGSPDSFFEDRDNYVFCEYTTLEKLHSGQTFINKLQSDIDHCFDVKKTGINKLNISKVILAFTQKITPKQHSLLTKKVKTHNPKAHLEIFSIQEIPLKLIQYPDFADYYFAGVTTVKSLFYTLPDFLKASERGLQPPLSNSFIGREDEIEKAKTYLLANDILIITGSQGVGKSKLAAHLAESFENEFDYEPRVIVSSPVSLWDDLKSFILPTKKYFIFFDDANKALNNLDYLLKFIISRPKGTIKIVITVRDYVRQELDKLFLNTFYEQITLKPFEDDNIREVVNKTLPDGFWLEASIMERILLLAKGNCRLALMASSSILKNNDIRILKDIFSLYEQYFQNVKSDISILGNSQSLKALGILSFFGVINRDDEKIAALLQDHFKISWNELWEELIDLHKLELVEILHSEVAKISDQVLSTFVFYKTFFDEKTAVINYSDWISIFIPEYQKKVKNTLIDIINTFGFRELKDRVTSLILNVQKKLETDEDNSYKFFEIFWFYREADTLVFISDWIDHLNEEQIAVSDIKFNYKENDFIWAPKFLKLLLNFVGHGNGYTKHAIELILKLMFRQPTNIPETLKHLKDHISFKRTDRNIHFSRQFHLLEVLENKSLEKEQIYICDNVFLSLVPSFLGWDYSQVEGNGKGKMLVHNFFLSKSTHLLELRRKILQRLFDLFSKYEQKVLDVFHKYTWNAREFDSSIYADEQEIVTDFFDKNLDPENYDHCKLIHKYTGRLKKHKIVISHDWSAFLNSTPMKIAKIFISEYYEGILKHDERELKQKQKISKYIKGKDIAFIKKNLDYLDTIYQIACINGDEHWIDTSLPRLFIELADKDINLYLKSLELVMVGGYSFNLDQGYFISYPIKQKLVGVRNMFDFLNRYNYKQRQFWNLLFFEAIVEKDIDEFFLQKLIDFLLSVSDYFCISHLEGYIKFDEVFQACKGKLFPSALKHENVVTYVAEIVLSRKNIANIYFDYHVCQDSASYFTGNLNLLKEIFYLNNKGNKHYDHSGKEMEAISFFDAYFLVHYLKEISKKSSLVDFNLDDSDLTFVWNLTGYENVIDQALEIFIAKSSSPRFEHQANILFSGLRPDSADHQKGLDYISRFISIHFKSKKHMKVILNIIVYCFNDQLLNFLKEFLILNKDCEFMQDLSLSRNGLASGSSVPRIEARIKFLKSLVEMVETLTNPLQYVNHVKYWEGQVECEKQFKKHEMKRDFIGWTD